MQTSSLFPDPGPLARVERGMHVVDAAGESIGKVEVVRLGDPESETTATTRRPPSQVTNIMAESVFVDDREPDVPQPLRDRLLRGGFIKVDGPGVLGTDRYITSEQVRDVSGNSVHLTVRKGDLAEH